jgi:hypothetical protein
LLVPVEHLRCRIDLVVMLAVREDRHLVQIGWEPRCRLGQVDETVSIIAVCAWMLSAKQSFA